MVYYGIFILRNLIRHGAGGCSRRAWCPPTFLKLVADPQKTYLVRSMYTFESLPAYPYKTPIDLELPRPI